MTDSQAMALIKAIEHLSDYVDLRDKPKHPLYRIADVLENIDRRLELIYKHGITFNKSGE